MSPKLSIILPVYNAEKYLDQTIDSILNQTFVDFELLIADDGSNDNSKSIIDHYGALDTRIVISHNPINEGKVRTVNRLYSISSGIYATIHDADDWSELNRFELQIAYLDANPEVGFCGSSFTQVFDKSTSLYKVECNTEKLIEQLKRESSLHGPTIMFRTNLISQVYQPYFEGYGEDYDLCLRLLDLSSPANLPDSLYNYRMRPTSLSKSLTLDKIFRHDVARYLAEQRRQNQTDDLLQGRESGIEDYINQLSHPYREDKSLIYVKQTERDMYFQFYPSAIVNSLRAIWISPLKFRNYKILQYCFRKIILQKITCLKKVNSNR